MSLYVCAYLCVVVLKRKYVIVSASLPKSVRVSVAMCVVARSYLYVCYKKKK